MGREKKSKRIGKGPKGGREEKVKFEVYGEEILPKKVRLSGNSGRIYLPQTGSDIRSRS